MVCTYAGRVVVSIFASLYGRNVILGQMHMDYCINVSVNTYIPQLGAVCSLHFNCSPSAYLKLSVTSL